MSEAAQNERESSAETYPVVASVLDSDRVVINIGASDGIKIGQRFLIYELSDEEIKDPLTDESLGRLEIPKGTGKIVGTQSRIAVLESDQEPSGNPRLPMSGTVTADFFTPAAMAPFRSPNVGDSVKRLY